MENEVTTGRTDGGPAPGHARTELRRLLAISFAALLSSTIYNIALPNVWIFQRGFPPSTVGAISMAYTVAYLAGPVIFLHVAKVLGLRGSLLLSAGSTVACAVLQAVVVDTGVLIAINAVNGVIDSMYWPGMHARLATIRASFHDRDNPGVFKRFGTSCIAGAIAGNLAGFAIISAGGSDALVLVLGILLMGLQVPAIWSLRGTRHTAGGSSGHDGHQAPAPRSRRDAAFMLLPVPVMLVAELAFQAIKGSFNLAFPFLLETSGEGSQWVYVVVLMQQVAQVIAITASASTGARGSFMLAIAGMAGTAAISAAAIPCTSILHASVTVVAGGLSCGLVYAFSTRMLLARASGKDRNKLASANELAGGFGFGIVPFFAGLIADVDFSGVFVLTLAIAVASLGAFAVAGQAARRAARRRGMSPPRVPVAILPPPRAGTARVRHHPAGSPTVHGTGPGGRSTTTKRAISSLPARACTDA